MRVSKKSEQVPVASNQEPPPPPPNAHTSPSPGHRLNLHYGGAEGHPPAAASFRQQSIQASCQTRPPSPTANLHNAVNLRNHCNEPNHTSRLGGPYAARTSSWPYVAWQRHRATPPPLTSCTCSTENGLSSCRFGCRFGCHLGSRFGCMLGGLARGLAALRLGSRFRFCPFNTQSRHSSHWAFIHTIVGVQGPCHSTRRGRVNIIIQYHQHHPSWLKLRKTKCSA